MTRLGVAIGRRWDATIIFVSVLFIVLLSGCGGGDGGADRGGTQDSVNVNLATVPMSDGGVDPAATLTLEEITTIAINQYDKTDGIMVGCYYGYFFDQWPWRGGSEGDNTTLGPTLEGGPIWVEIDVKADSVVLISGRLRFSIATAIWESRGKIYKHTEYDFWNGPELTSGVIWEDYIKIFKGPQIQVGDWVHLKVNLSDLIATSYGMTEGYLQALYVVAEWDGNNSSAISFRNFQVYRTK